MMTTSDVCYKNPVNNGTINFHNDNFLSSPFMAEVPRVGYITE